MKLGTVIKTEEKTTNREFLHRGKALRECHVDFEPHMAAHAACEVSVPEAVFVREEVA